MFVRLRSAASCISVATIVLLIPSHVEAQTPPSTGLKLWLKADDSTAVSTDATNPDGTPANHSNVNSWGDETGNFTVSQTGGSRPTYIKSDINSMPALHFNGSQSLYNPSNIGLNADMTMIVVSNTTNVGANEAELWLGNGNFGLNGESRGVGYWNSAQHFSGYGVDIFGGTPPNNGNLFSAQIASLNPQLNSVQFYINGIPNGNPGVSGLQNVLPGICVGEVESVNGFNWTGDIAEVMVYDHQLSATELQEVGQYLADKYGLYHPYATWPQNFSAEVQGEITRNHWNESQAVAYAHMETTNPTVQTHGLVQWLKANDSTAVSTDATNPDGTPANNSNVNSWADETGNFTVSQTGGSRPTYVSSDINSKSALHFNGSQSLYNPSNIGLNADMTMIVVSNTTNVGANEAELWLGNGNFGLNGESRGMGYWNSAQHFSGYGVDIFGGTPPSNGNLFSAQIASLNPQLNSVQFYLNGVPNGNPGVSGLQNMLPGICVGEVESVNGFNWTGDIAEVMVYDHQLSTTELQGVGQYLADKYGLYNSNATWPLSYSVAVQAEITRNQWNKSQADTYVAFQNANPSMLTNGLKAWYKADALPANSASVGTWSDQTGNYPVTQATTGSQPTYVANDINGEPALHFSGGQTLLTSASFGAGVNGDITIISVGSTTQPGTQQYSAYIGNTGANTSRGIGYQYGYQAFSLAYNDNYGAAAPSANTFVSEAALVSSNVSSVTYYRNGVQTGTSTLGGAQNISPGFAVGSYYGLGGFWQGDLAEVLVYDHQLSVTELQDVGVYLANKYALPSTAPLAVFPPTGNYYQQLQVSLLSAVPGVPVYYTTDGSTPTAASTPYTGPFTLSSGAGTTITTVNAVAIPLGQSPSSVYSSTYTILPYPPGSVAATPAANPASSPFGGSLSVTLASGTPGASIFYTTDGTNPTHNGASPTNSTILYSGSISLSATVTLHAIASYAGLNDSAVMTQNYTLDATGPSISNVQFNGSGLPNNGVLSGTGVLSASVISPYTITKVEFYIDGTLIATDTNGADGYSTFVDPAQLTDGNHILKISAYDNYSVRSDLTQSFTVALAAPPAPTITSPANNITTTYSQIAVSGAAAPNTTITFLVNGTPVTGQATVTAAQDGTFLGTVSLAVGQNQIQATATNRAGTGTASSIVTVTYDNTLPQPTTSVSVTSRSGGQVSLNWTASNTASVGGYEIFRSTSPITSINGLTPIATVTGLTYTDLPPTDGSYYYTVITVGSNGLDSPLSSIPTGVSDRTAPTASIQYVAQGAYDSTTGNYGVDTVSVTVTTSEPLSATPFLTILPPNGLPLPVLLSPGVDNLHYVGTLMIASTTPSGQAAASFSGLDLAGNRGTQITNGQKLNIVTAGPQVTQLLVNPNGAIQNNSSSPTTVNFTATVIATGNELLPGGTVPQFSYSLSSTATTPVAISNVTPGTDPNTWNVSLPLTSTAGQTPETLTLFYQATDNLGNVGSQIVPAHQYQVYQGNLPGLNPPAQLTTRSLPAGIVQLTWTSVPQATGYAVYRGTSPNALSQLATVSTVLTYQDTTAQPDGTYYYSVATSWQQGSQQSVGAQSNPVVPGVSISVTPPGPSGLSAQVISTGVQLGWTDPVNPTSVVTLSLYRSSSSITSLTGLTPLVSKIPLGLQTAVDPTPLPSQPYYALVAVDAASNISSLTSSYANVSLLPVTAFTITQTGSNSPVVTWSDPTPGLSGYDIFLGPTGSQVKLDNPGPLPASTTSYTDTGYSGTAQQFTVTAYDANGVASPARSLSLVPLTATLDPSAVIERGLPNQLNYTVTNPSAQAVSNIQLVVNVGGVNQASSVFSLNGGATAVIPVVVGGYSSLTGSSTSVTTTIQVKPNPGELVSIVQSGTVPVAAGQLGLQVLASNFTLGGAGQAQFTLTNTSEVPIEIICAEATGNQPSPDVHFNLMDANGDIVAQQALQLTTGNDVTTLTSGESVIQLPPGASVTTSPVNITVPANLGASVTVQAQINHIYYDRGLADEVDLSGLQAKQTVATTQVPYSGLVTSVTPANSTGNQPIVISGIALVTGSSPTNPTPVPNANLSLNISTNGFLRTFPITTDSSGNFSYTFNPVAGEPGGAYNVWAINPLLTDSTPQMQFTIQTLIVNPTTINLQAPTNFAQTLTLNLTNSPAGALTNVSVAYNAADQPGGAFAQGITVTPGAPIAQLSASQASSLQATILADGTAPSSGTLYLRVASTENPNWQLVQVNYSFAPAVPNLVVTPSAPTLGVAPGQSISQTISLTNVGLAPLTGANIVLQTNQGTMPPAWATLSSASTINSLAVNASQNISVTFAPGTSVALAGYDFNLVITAQNYPSYTVPIHVNVNTSATSHGSFLVVDALSGGTVSNGFTDASGHTAGLAGAIITLQNQSNYALVYTATTDQYGQATFGEASETPLPVGTYTVQITASQHQTYSSTLVVQPGVPFIQQIVLQYNPVSVTWNVTPTTIQDQYNLVFTTTFNTNVQLPVVTFTPSVINLPQLNQGDVYNVQATITNNGLIAANNIQIQLPPDDAYFHYALLGTPPTSLAASGSTGSSATLYYKLTCLQSMPSPSSVSLNSKGKSDRMFVNNVERHPMPILCRLMSMVWGQISPNTNSYGATVGLAYSANCSNGTTFNGNASETFSYLIAGTPQAALDNGETIVTQQGGSGSEDATGGGKAPPIGTPPAKKCNLTCDILLGTPPLPKPVNDTSVNHSQNRVNPGGVVVMDYSDDDANGTYDYLDSSTNFEGIISITKKNRLTELDLTTTGTNGTLTLSATTNPTNVRIWVADGNGKMHLAQDGELTWTITSGSYSPASSSSPQPGGSLPIRVYAEGVQEGATNLSLNYSGSDSSGPVNDSATLNVITFRIIADVNNDGFITDADYRAQLAGANPNANPGQVATATEYMFDNDQISNGGGTGEWDREDPTAPAGTTTDDDVEEIDITCNATTGTISLNHSPYANYGSANGFFNLYSDPGCTQMVSFPFTITPANPLPSKLYIRGTGLLPQESSGNLIATFTTAVGGSALVQQQLKLDIVKQFGDLNFFPAARAWIYKHNSTIFVKDWYSKNISGGPRRVCVTLGETTSIRPFETYYNTIQLAGLQEVASANPNAVEVVNGNLVGLTDGTSEHSPFTYLRAAELNILHLSSNQLGLPTFLMADHCFGRLIQDGGLSPASLDNGDNYTPSVDPEHYAGTQLPISQFGGDKAGYLSSNSASPGVYFGTGRVPGFTNSYFASIDPTTNVISLVLSQSVNGPQPYQALGGLILSSTAIANEKLDSESNQIIGDWSDSYGHSAIFTATSQGGIGVVLPLILPSAFDFISSHNLPSAATIGISGSINHFYFLDSGPDSVGLARDNPSSLLGIETGFTGYKMLYGIPFYPDVYLTLQGSKPRQN